MPSITIFARSTLDWGTNFSDLCDAGANVIFRENAFSNVISRKIMWNDIPFNVSCFHEIFCIWFVNLYICMYNVCLYSRDFTGKIRSNIFFASPLWFHEKKRVPFSSVHVISRVFWLFHWNPIWMALNWHSQMGLIFAVLLISFP